MSACLARVTRLGTKRWLISLFSSSRSTIGIAAAPRSAISRRLTSRTTESRRSRSEKPREAPSRLDAQAAHPHHAGDPLVDHQVTSCVQFAGHCKARRPHGSARPGLSLGRARGRASVYAFSGVRAGRVLQVSADAGRNRPRRRQSGKRMLAVNEKQQVR